MEIFESTSIRCKILIKKLTIYLLFFVSVWTPPTFASTAVSGLPSGWSQSVIYNGKLVNPASICNYTNGDMLIMDICNNEVMRLDSEGELTLFASIDSNTLWAVAYQSGKNRVIATDASALYTLEDSKLTLLTTFKDNFVASSLAVNPVDDSIFCGHFSNGSQIRHYDAGGNYLETLANNVGGAFTLAVDSTGSKLYYGDMANGKIVSVNLNDKTQTVLVSGLGNQGADDPVVVALDNSDNVYFGLPDIGINLYKDGSYNMVAPPSPVGGNGPMVWSSTRNAFVGITQMGANVVKYDVQKNEADCLTENVNSYLIAPLADGRILIATENKIIRLDSNGQTSTYWETSAGEINAMDIDGNGQIYLSLRNENTSDRISKLASDGSLVTLAEGYSNGQLDRFRYDPYNNALVAMVIDTNGSSFWRIPIDASTNAERVSIIADDTDPYMTFALDRSGHIYTYKPATNTLYRIDDGSNEPTVILENVYSTDGLYRPPLIYSSKENSLIAALNDTLDAWPLSGGSISTFATDTCGVDNAGLYEKNNGDIIATHAGQVFLMSYQATDVTQPTDTDTTTTTPTETDTEQTNHNDSSGGGTCFIKAIIP